MEKEAKAKGDRSMCAHICVCVFVRARVRVCVGGKLCLIQSILFDQSRVHALSPLGFKNCQSVKRFE